MGLKRKKLSVIIEVVGDKMIKIDNDFLEEVGLEEMSAEQKRSFIRHTQEELEVRIGEEMSKGMTVEQLAEFDGIMNGNISAMVKILEKEKNYQEDPIYQIFLKRHNAVEPTPEILSEFLSVKWIKKNRPNYRQLAERELERLKLEILGDREKILQVI